MTWQVCLARIEGALALVCLVAGAALAQVSEGYRSNTYFDCPYINYFDRDCPQLQPPVAAAGPDVPEPEEEDAPPADDLVSPGAAMQRYLEMQERLGVQRDLFPPQSMAPDTPPLFHELLAGPSLAMARLYVLWHAARNERLGEVNDLIAIVGAELEAEVKADGTAGDRGTVGRPAGR